MVSLGVAIVLPLLAAGNHTPSELHVSCRAPSLSSLRAHVTHAANVLLWRQHPSLDLRPYVAASSQGTVPPSLAHRLSGCSSFGPLRCPHARHAGSRCGALTPKRVTALHRCGNELVHTGLSQPSHRTSSPCRSLPPCIVGKMPTRILSLGLKGSSLMFCFSSSASFSLDFQSSQFALELLARLHEHLLLQLAPAELVTVMLVLLLILQTRHTKLHLVAEVSRFSSITFSPVVARSCRPGGSVDFMSRQLSCWSLPSLPTSGGTDPRLWPRRCNDPHLTSRRC
mmetsp:Transcript_49444/g.159109  ORF Transcript_49444/g.159109 Transcript_49444/m.159109 type:complete len:283 (-) Transcript_49444:522-1370(-)